MAADECDDGDCCDKGACDKPQQLKPAAQAATAPVSTLPSGGAGKKGCCEPKPPGGGCDDSECCDNGACDKPLQLKPAAPAPPPVSTLQSGGDGKKGCCEPKPLINLAYRPKPDSSAGESAATAKPPESVSVAVEVPPARKCDACTDAPDALPHVMVRTALRVRGLCCESEVRLVEKLLRPMRGLSPKDAIDVNVLSKMVYVQHCAAHCCLPPEQIATTLNGAQLGAALALGARGDGDGADGAGALASRGPYAYCALLWLLLALGALGSPLRLFGHGAARAVLAGCSLLGVAPIALAVARATIAAGELAVEMKLLMLAATVGAMAVGEECDAALLVSLYAAAQLVEHAAMERVGAALRAATHLAQPSTATRASDGAPVALSELRAGDRIALRAGEQCISEGVVVSGKAVVSEAALTGEHAPRTVVKGAALAAGCLVMHGYCELELSAAPAQSELAKAAQLVALAQTQRPVAQAAVDRFARLWTPAVLLAALGVAAWGLARGAGASAAVRPALSLLLLACPCSLVLAAPIPSACAIASAASHGVLIRAASALDALADVRSLAADKTGTLTSGHFAVIAAERFGGSAGGADDAPEVARLLRLAAAVEARSAHPLAHAVVAQAMGCVGEGGVSLPKASHFRALEGVGVQADVLDDSLGGEAVTVVVGNSRTLDWAGCAQPGARWFAAFEAARPNDATLVVVVDGAPVLALALNDAPRAEAAEAVALLRSLGVETTMLTGASAGSAAPVAAALRLAGWHAGLLPAHKASWVRERRAAGPVAMLGDGINDALALAEADVGVAMGGTGTALACEAASVVLLDEDLRRLPQAIAHARRARRVVRANICLSMGAKLVAAALAVAGLLPLYIAVGLDMGVTLLILAIGTLMLRDDAWRAREPRPQPPRRSPRAAREHELDVPAAGLRKPLLPERGARAGSDAPS